MLLGLLGASCIIVLFFFAGMYMFYQYFQEKEAAEESARWSTTQGEITKSDLRREASIESTNSLYYPDVEYKYEFLDTEYIGQRISFGGETGYSMRSKTEEILEKYPVGQSMTVYYDPNEPEEAVLERNMGTGGKLFMWLGLAFVIFSLCFLCVMVGLTGTSWMTV